MNKKLRPFIATHPGELIKDELKERNLTQKELSEMTGIKPSVLSETIHGKRSVSLNVAIALEKALGIPAEIWMNLQTQYDLDSAQIAEHEKQKETVSITIPISDLNLLREISRKFGWACMF
jgi:addiction module HigA family antidote